MAYLYPYGDTQQLNLDWLIEQWNEVKSQIDGSLQAEIDRVEAAISDLLTARDEAVAAQTAAQASAQAAAGSASTASGAASTATAQAQAAAGSAATAGAHASDAQGYAATAQQEAQAANNSASAAAVSEGNARNSETAAAGSSSAAAGNALYAEGYAKGTQNGNPVSSGSPYYENNAKYYAGETAADALEAEGWAVGEQNGTPVSSGSPYYQNNAKYYAQSAGAGDADAMIAPEETSSTAAAAYAPGDYFRMSGDLYIATNPIAIGDTITAGTNCRKTTLAENIEGISAGIPFDSFGLFNFPSHATAESSSAHVEFAVEKDICSMYHKSAGSGNTTFRLLDGKLGTTSPNAAYLQTYGLKVPDYSLAKITAQILQSDIVDSNFANSLRLYYQLTDGSVTYKEIPLTRQAGNSLYDVTVNIKDTDVYLLPMLFKTGESLTVGSKLKAKFKIEIINRLQHDNIASGAYYPALGIPGYVFLAIENIAAGTPITIGSPANAQFQHISTALNYIATH